MAADQSNRGWFLYNDSFGDQWNKMGAIDAACNAIDGNAPANGSKPDYPKKSRRRQPRTAIFLDPTTFRTKSCIMYTAAAAEALTGASTVAVHVPGETATVTYTFDHLVPDKAPRKSVSRNLADHA